MVLSAACAGLLLHTASTLQIARRCTLLHHAAMPSTYSHGNLRGDDSPLRSRSFEGRFGRMFRNLPPAQFDPDDLANLSKEMISRAERVPDGERDPAESRTPAGYTYLGQFIAHDITFDPVSSLERDNDPDALVDYRTPRFDLDSVYGRGPVDQPYLYEDDVRLVLGQKLSNDKDYDVPRVESTERAIIGDPRNDENVIITQLHAIFLRFHNSLANALGERGRDSPPFKSSCGGTISGSCCTTSCDELLTKKHTMQFCHTSP